MSKRKTLPYDSASGLVLRSANYLPYNQLVKRMRETDTVFFDEKILDAKMGTVLYRFDRGVDTVKRKLSQLRELLFEITEEVEKRSDSDDDEKKQGVEKTGAVDTESEENTLDDKLATAVDFIEEVWGTRLDEQLHINELVKGCETLKLRLFHYIMDGNRLRLERNWLEERLMAADSSYEKGGYEASFQKRRKGDSDSEVDSDDEQIERMLEKGPISFDGDASSFGDD
jgi:regulator of replication initiation timing